LFTELLDGMALGSSRDGGDFVSAQDVCWNKETFKFRCLWHNIVEMLSVIDCNILWFV